MHLRPIVVFRLLAAAALAGAAAARADERPAPAAPQRIDVDFLFSYYDQTGEHSAVTGGTGSEAQDVISPVFLVGWTVNDDWTLRADLGVDQVTSASVDAIDAHVSSASRVDQRAFVDLTATRRLGDQSLAVTLGFSSEYDYRSLSAGLGWSADLNQRNTTLSASLRHYEDTVELYDVDGVNRGGEGRRTTDLSAGLTQVLGTGTVGTLELDLTLQDGLLSTPFHEVVLVPRDGASEGAHVAERLPDARRRAALGLGLSHAFGRAVVQKLSYRLYDDDWGIRAHSLAAETHFRLPGRSETWIYPILRYHTQTAADAFGPTGSFTGDEEFFTSDWDLAEVTTEKYGLGVRRLAPPGRSWWLGLRRWEGRFTLFSRDDGLAGVTASFGLGWSF